MLMETPLSQALFITTGLIHNYKRVSTHNPTSEDQFHTTPMMTLHSPATSTMTGLMYRQANLSTHNQILEDQSHIMLTMIQHSPATSTMTGLMFKPMSILNLISVAQLHTMLTETPLSQALFIMI